MDSDIPSWSDMADSPEYDRLSLFDDSNGGWNYDGDGDLIMGWME